MRDCARERGLSGCWDCADEAGCDKLSMLDQGDPTMPGNRRQIREIGLEAWLAEQVAKIQ